MAQPIPDRNVPNYLIPSILATLCCCLPAGIVSIIYAAQV
ncbi:MAG: CD225/dispanin family protein, partial [Gemmatimonadota bacterium]|nr:CD225/dispanin family protein [Gemmatimonadota bacterium]